MSKKKSAENKEKTIRPIFTLLTACCDGEKYVDQWKRSVINQTYRPLNVVVIDDLSKDKSSRQLEKSIKSFKNNNVSVRIVRPEKKLYYGGSLREAYLQAEGDFFGIFDIDDYLEPHSVEHVMNLYLQHPKICYIYTQFLTCDKELRPKKPGWCCSPPPKESILSMGLKQVHVYSHFRTFSNRAKDMVDIFPKRGRYAVDQHMGLMLERKGYGMFTNKVCYHYRTDVENSISANFGSQRRKYWFKLIEHFSKNNKKTYRIIEDANCR